jgi:hypothetical protein
MPQLPQEPVQQANKFGPAAELFPGRPAVTGLPCHQVYSLA